jgi:UDP-N-acetylmuramoyl-tripeptide--D-alanyl-D-alanine ligase
MNEMPVRLTALEIAQASGGRLSLGDPARRFDVFGIDSRAIVAGQLFFAIVGARLDGHAFVAEALARGAGGVVVATGRGPAATAPGGDRAPVVIEVEDTTAALQQTGRELRRRVDPTVVAITGSAGKTTTKDVTAAFLSLRHRTFANRGNLNNHIGLPLSLFELARLPEPPDYAVLELGMSAHGEIRTLVRTCEPDVRVWTNVAEAHLAQFASVDDIAVAKAEILELAGPGTVLVANAGDSRVMSHAARFDGRAVTFGLDAAADVAATGIESRGLAGMAADITTPAGRVRLETPLAGRGNLANVLAALAVGLEAGVPLEAMAERARTLKPPAHRGEVRSLPSGATLYDDAYNANPLAVTRALEVIGAESPSGRRVAVLGEMLELGADAPALHARCGEAAARAGVSVLVTVGGPPARALGAAAVAAGVPGSDVHHAETSEEAAGLVASLVRPGDLILVKGSRGVRLERVVEALGGAGA